MISSLLKCFFKTREYVNGCSTFKEYPCWLKYFAVFLLLYYERWISQGWALADLDVLLRWQKFLNFELTGTFASFIMSHLPLGLKLNRWPAEWSAGSNAQDNFFPSTYPRISDAHFFVMIQSRKLLEGPYFSYADKAAVYSLKSFYLNLFFFF